MKKVLSFLAAGLFIGCTFSAPTTTVSLEIGKNKLTNQYYDQLKADVSYSLKDRWNIGLDMSAAQVRDTNELSVATEAYATYNIGKKPWDLMSYITATIGEQFTNGNNYAYYTVKPAIKHKLYKEFNWFVSYEYRNAFESAVTAEYLKYSAGVDTAFKGHTVTLAPFITRGDARVAGAELSVSL